MNLLFRKQFISNINSIGPVRKMNSSDASLRFKPEGECFLNVESKAGATLNANFLRHDVEVQVRGGLSMLL